MLEYYVLSFLLLLIVTTILCLIMGSDSECNIQQMLRDYEDYINNLQNEIIKNKKIIASLKKKINLFRKKNLKNVVK